ncbi:MAG: TlpA family protein disulfide reductase [Phycisphaerales bacterium]
MIKAFQTQHLLAAAFLLIALLTPKLIAQDDPRQILQDSAQALLDTPGFAAKATLTGDGSKMILSTLPAMTGRVTVGTHSEYGKVMHMLGELRPTAAAPPESFDLIYSAERYIWSDHPKQTLNIRPPSVSARQRPTAFSYLLITEVMSDAPYQKELNTAESIELEESQMIAGTDCHVVLINRAKPKGRTIGGHTQERWFIGKEDNLPRRLEQITDAGMIKASLIMELADLTQGVQSDKDLAVFVPETYKTSDTVKNRGTGPKTGTKKIGTNVNKNTISNENQNFNTPTAPRKPVAPNYTFTDIDNNTFSNDTQSGRITVIQFAGSWSIPSRETSPMLSNLASEFGDQIDVFALSIREMDKDTVKNDHIALGYIHTLVINPSDAVADAFRARIFPTIVIISADGRIAYKQNLNKNLTAEALLAEVKAAINEELAKP